MKLGAENRTKLALACVLFVTAVILLARMFATGGQPAAAATAAQKPAAEPPRAVATRGRRARPRAAARAEEAPSNTLSLDPRLRLDLLKASEDTEYKGAGRNIFRAMAEPVIPAPVAPAVKKAENLPPPGPPPPPPPPPINLKFIGVANTADEPTKALLSSGDDVFVAKEGDIVNRRYKVLKINPKSVEIEDVLSNNRQTIPLTQG